MVRHCASRALEMSCSPPCTLRTLQRCAGSSLSHSARRRELPIVCESTSFWGGFQAPFPSRRSPQAALILSCRSDRVTRDWPVALREHAAQTETRRGFGWRRAEVAFEELRDDEHVRDGAMHIEQSAAAPAPARK